MANNPFDQRIINQLERPTSSDLNIAQGQINANVRAFARQLLQSTQSAYASGTGPGGALGNSFIIRAAAAPSLTEVTMTRGVGFASFTPSIENIGGITGLSTNLDYPVIYSQDQVLDLSGVAAPAAGTCRRDVIAIRAIGQAANGLTDSGDTDIYEPTLEAFQSAPRFKTLTADLTNQNLEVIESTDTPTGALVYIKGAAVSYVDQDSLLSAPITTAGSGAGPYNNIAIINRYDGQTEITESDIVDYRLVASPGGQLTITGSATVGATSSTTPGAALSNVVLKAPPGIKAAIYKLGADSATETNTYALIVAGPRGIASASMTCTLGIPGSSVTDTLFPSQVVLGAQSRNLSADDATVTLLANSAKSSPVQTVAVGQPYHVFPFTVGTVENVLVSATVPVTVSGGSITIDDPPDYPAMYPAGTYDVVGNNDIRTFYLNHSVPAVAPTTNLPALTYSLGTSATSTAYTYTNNDIPDTETRIAGFVADSNFLIEDWAAGVWKLTLNASTSATGYTYSLAVVKAKVFLYDNATNPEAGTLIADSDEMLVPWGTSNASSLALTMRLPATLTNDKRIYIALYGRSTAPAVTVALRVYFGSDNAAILATNILAPTPTVTIPNSTTNYPAAIYPVTGASGSANLGLIPTGQPIFKPTATRFGTSGLTDLRTIPVNFTVTLNRS